MNRHQWQQKMTTQSDNTISSSQIQHHYNIASERLKQEMFPAMEKISQACGFIWSHVGQLNFRLSRGLTQLSYVSALYCLDSYGNQIAQAQTKRRGEEGQDSELTYENSQRAYAWEISPNITFLVTKVYYNYATGRQSISVVHTIKNSSGTLLGYLCAEFDMADLMLLISSAYLKNELPVDSAVPRHLLLQ